MEHLHFITTGGTIDKQYNTEKSTYDFSIGSPAVETILTRLPNKNFTHTITEICKIDSLNMTIENRKEIKNACEHSPSENIIITHGTDSMIETAKYLSEHFTTKTIILTGASQPEKFKQSDADLNIGTAIGATDILPQGVHIAIHGQIYKPREVFKNENGSFKLKK